MCFHGRIFVTGVQQTIWHTPDVALVYSYLMISGCVCVAHTSSLVGMFKEAHSFLAGEDEVERTLSIHTLTQ